MSKPLWKCGICGESLVSLGSHYKNMHKTYYIKGKTSASYVEKPKQKPTAAQQESSEEKASFNIPLHALRGKTFEENDRRGRALLSFHIGRNKLAGVDPEIIENSTIFDPTKPRHKVIPWGPKTMAEIAAKKKTTALRLLSQEAV